MNALVRLKKVTPPFVIALLLLVPDLPAKAQMTSSAVDRKDLLHSPQRRGAPMKDGNWLGKPTLVPGPDVIVGNLPSLQQFGDAGTQVGLAVGTESCNNGQVDVDWFALPSNDH